MGSEPEKGLWKHLHPVNEAEQYILSCMINDKKKKSRNCGERYIDARAEAEEVMPSILRSKREWGIREWARGFFIGIPLEIMKETIPQDVKYMDRGQISTVSGNYQYVILKCDDRFVAFIDSGNMIYGISVEDLEKRIWENIRSSHR